MSRAQQISLLGREPPAVDERFATLRRIQLDESAWIEHAPSWVAGHALLMDELVRSTSWQSQRMEIYDRTVDVPRLLASLPEDGPVHPLLEQMRRALAARYAIALPHLTLALYRDGRDSVAFHGDRVARNMPEALVATVSLGEPRRFLLRKGPSEGPLDPPRWARTGKAGASPTRSPRRSVALSLGWGDLLVMGGACQRTWQHGIPKVAAAGPRMAVMFRPDWYRPPPANDQNGNAETK
jgi:alkylated DNA repair dioxygenase AlkB